jgi:hypothetical protein
MTKSLSKTDSRRRLLTDAQWQWVANGVLAGAFATITLWGTFVL